MGTYSNFDGEIRIDPPLNWKQIQECPYGSGWSKGGDIRLELTTEEKDTEEGKVQIISCDLLLPASPHFKGYHMEEHIREVVQKFPDHTFSGCIDVVTESGDRSRIVVGKDREVRTITPEIIWPEH